MAYSLKMKTHPALLAELIYGCIKNVVDSMKISMTENNLLQTLKSIKK